MRLYLVEVLGGAWQGRVVIRRVGQSLYDEGDDCCDAGEFGDGDGIVGSHKEKRMGERWATRLGEEGWCWWVGGRGNGRGNVCD